MPLPVAAMLILWHNEIYHVFAFISSEVPMKSTTGKITKRRNQKERQKNEGKSFWFSYLNGNNLQFLKLLI